EVDRGARGGEGEGERCGVEFGGDLDAGAGPGGERHEGVGGGERAAPAGVLAGRAAAWAGSAAGAQQAPHAVALARRTTTASASRATASGAGERRPSRSRARRRPRGRRATVPTR